SWPPRHSRTTGFCRRTAHSRSWPPYLSESGAEALYRLIDAAYDRRSLILTSNLHPARFDTIFPNGLATAAVDRLLHHAHVIVTEGQSHRLTEALDGRGVAPPRGRRIT